MKTRDTLAVVDDSYFYRAAQPRLAIVPENIDLQTLLEIAESAKITHLWLVPGTGVSRDCSQAGGSEIEGWNIVPIYMDSKTRSRYSFLSARRNNARVDKMIYVSFPEFSRWPWRGDDNPKTLLATITYLEDALGFNLEWTPAHASIEYVRMKNADRWSWLQPMTLDLEALADSFSYTNIAKEMHWPPRGLEPIIPPEATHLIRIDGNSDYAAGMTGLNVGEGNPAHVWHPGYDGKLPGFWRAKIRPGKSWFNGRDLPLIDQEWLTTDLVEQLRAAGYEIEIVEGWTWEKHHQTLRSTAEDLWKLRTAWRDLRGKSQAHENVYESIRVILKAIHGKMARPDTEVHFRRRDIWALVVARAVAMRVRKIEKIYKEYGLLPVRIKADEFTYAVTDPHLFDKMLTPDKLGGFKLVEIIALDKRPEVTK